MSIFDNFFQKLFGRRSDRRSPDEGFEDHRQRGDGFRNPIWQTDDEYDDDPNDFRQPGRVTRFDVFTDPFEMTRYFESQMEGMLKNFVYGFGHGFDNDAERFHGDGYPPMLAEPSQKSLRDEILKPGYERPTPKGSNDTKSDIDLDGRLSAADLAVMKKELDVLKSGSLDRGLSSDTFGKSFSSRTVRRPDGSVECRQTITDSEGNTETTVTRTFGDKIHTIKTKRDKSGEETKTEDLINMDETQFADFEKKWQPVAEPKFQPGALNQFPWHKYFNFDPKL